MADADVVGTMPGIAIDGALPRHVAETRTEAEHAFEFRGNAFEYFRIWIVNFALSIVTLGVFSAWAKVRRERYFYGNTWVAGTPFEYLASPINILKGRIIAVALLTLYVVAGETLPFAQIGVVILVLIVTPFLLVSALRFRARYSAWNSVSFRFTGQMGDAAMYYLVMYLLLIPTLGFIYPYIRYRQRRFVIEGHRFGGHPFTFAASASDFFVIYLVASLVGAGVAIAALVVFGGLLLPIANTIGADTPETFGAYGAIGAVVVTYGAMFVAWVYIASRVSNLGFNSTTLVAHGFRSTIRARDLLWIYLSNTAAILLSVGLLVPWAQVRLARYRAGHLKFVTRGDYQSFANELRQERSAAGAETADIFDLDLSL